MIRAWPWTVRRIVVAARCTAGRACASGRTISSSALTLIRLSGCFSSCDITARNSLFSSLSWIASSMPASAAVSRRASSSWAVAISVVSRQILA